MKKIESIWLPDTQQKIFRVLMEAMARPGKIEDLAVLTQDENALRATMATLMDAEVSLCDQHGLLDAADWPLLQCRQQDAQHAGYIVCDGGQAADFEPRLGTLASPEFGATLIIKVADLQQGKAKLKLSGPGVNGDCEIALSGFDKSWLQQRAQWNSAFPLGVDIVLVDDGHVMAWPRTTKIEVSSWDM
ncbi:MAG: phosphonate C-P lyase system protein PhnH [Methylophaga sp.]